MTMIKSIKKIVLSTAAVVAIGAGSLGTANAGVFLYNAPVYVPTCHLISVPYVNPYTGWTYFVTRQICN
jgi:multidrug transporter EmrE-like cation transporter